MERFRSLYGSDPLYSWVGLDSDYIYAAHKAAGGITSFYRQLGIGCERLVREILSGYYGFSSEEVNWSYEYKNAQGKTARLSLDARIDVEFIKDQKAIDRIQDWSRDCLLQLKNPVKGLKGLVFEIRQGYKSADSKRQNADLRNAIRAYNEGYLPVLMIMSNQLNETIRNRYSASQILVLSGRMSGNSKDCTYAFFKDIVGFDLEGFFKKNKNTIRSEIQGILRNLVNP